MAFRTVAILGNRAALQIQRDKAKERKIDGCPDQEEAVREESPLGVEERIDSFGNVPPTPKRRGAIHQRGAEKEQRQEKQHEIRQQAGDIFQLASNDYRPRRIRGVMETSPKQSTDGDGEKIGKAKEPGK